MWNKRNKDYGTCKIFDAILDIVQNQQSVLNPKYSENIVGGQFSYLIWFTFSLSRTFLLVNGFRMAAIN